MKPKRILVVAVALGALLVAGAAYAATLNTYAAKFTFTSKKAGTASKPVPIGFTQDFKAKNATAGQRTAVLTDLKTTLYGVKVDTADFPTCSKTTIADTNKGNDDQCPKGSLVASGSITALLGPPSDPTNAGAPCNPLLHVYNSGKGKVTFFFVPTAKGTPHACAGGILAKGSVPPYPGTIKKSGKNLVLDVPIPTYVDFPLPGAEGSLTSEHLVWAKLTTKKKGKTVSFLSSVGCKGGKRPVAQSFTATASQTGPKQTNTLPSSVACSK